MLTAIALFLLTQTGTCKTGAVCTAAGVQMPAVAFANLPACNTAQKRQMRADSTNNCITYCNGSAWSCIATFASSAPSPWYYDGGTITNVPQHIKVQTGSGGFRTDGGIEAGSPGLVVRNDNGNGFILTCDTNAQAILTGGISGATFNAFGGTYGFYYFGAGTTALTAANAMVQLSGSNGYVISGTTTVTLPTCNSGTEGAVIYDTTTKTVKFCNGTVWGNI